MFELTSAAFQPSARIPKKYACDGKGVSPPLAWSGAPSEADFIALIMEDPDAPGGTWVHWVIYDVPATAGALPEGVAAEETLPDGSMQGSSWGVDEFERVGYGGPCPPPGKPHRYVFTAYALARTAGLAPRATKDELLQAIKGKVLAKAQLVGVYGR